LGAAGAEESEESRHAVTHWKMCLLCFSNLAKVTWMKTQAVQIRKIVSSKAEIDGQLKGTVSYPK